MAIQNRRGVYSNFTPSKMVPGEFAVVQSGDPNAANGQAVYIAFQSGQVKRLATHEDIQTEIASATQEVAAEISQRVEDAVADDVQAAQTAASNASTSASTASTKANEAAASATQAAGIVANIIDNTLTQTGKAADAKKTGDEITSLKGDLNTLSDEVENAPEMKDSEKTGVDLDISDADGNVIVRFKDGHIMTKEFDSSNIETDSGAYVDNSTTESVDLDISDLDGNVVGRFKDGHFQTKNFNSLTLINQVQIISQDVQGKFDIDQGSENAGKYLVINPNGEVSPTEISEKPAVETFYVTDNFVNGTALNLTISKRFSKGDRVLFHVEDGYENYEAGALATYYEDSTTIVASRRGSNGYYEHIVTKDNAVLSIRIPASGYSDDRQVTLYVYRINGEVKPKIVTVKADGTGMFTTIRGAIDSITDANFYTNPYVIEVYPGVYDVLADYTDEEINAVENPYTQTSFVGPKLTDGISMKGVGGTRDDIVLTATLDPSDWGSDVRGQVSTLNTQGSGSLENLTILAYNIRYCVHDDFRNPSNQVTFRRLKNLKFDGSLTNTPKFSTYGAGMSTPRDYIIEDCDFMYTIGIHGNTNYAVPCHIKIDNCSGYALVIGDYADENTDAVINVEVNNCDFERIYINQHTPLTDPHVRLYGVGNERTMVVASNIYPYVFGNITRIEPGFTVGNVVAHTNGVDLFELTANKDVMFGIVLYTDTDHSYVITSGYLQADRIGLTNLSVGDYVTIDSTTKTVVSGGSASDAIGVVTAIDATGAAIIKINN